MKNLQNIGFGIASFLILIGLQMHAQTSELAFTKNNNQWVQDIAYKADLPGGALFLTNNKFVYSFYNVKDLDAIHDAKCHAKNDNRAHKHEHNSKGDEMVHFHAFEMEMLHANKNSIFIEDEILPAYKNFIIGSDANKWASKVFSYKKITYNKIYNGIDLSVYSKGSFVKYDFIVKPNANANDIQLHFNGVAPKLLPNGDLRIKTSVNTLTELAPYAYQLIDGKQIQVLCNFKLQNNIISYNFPKGYNKNIELVIDPTMMYKTYSGSTVSTYGWSATYDALGRLYAGGQVFGVGWPASMGAYQTAFGGNVDAGINVYSPNGSALIYSTYFGGSLSDTPNSMVVNSNGELVVCGTTLSTNLPTTVGCIDNTSNGATDIYVAHFNATGTALLGATYMGGNGSDGANNHEVNIDNNGDIIVASNTSSTNFPTTAGAIQTANAGGGVEGCFFKINPSCTNLLFSSYLGGSGNDFCKSILQNANGNYVICGSTNSANFPTSAGAWHSTFQGGFGLGDGFVTIVNSTATALVASTYLGTNDDDGAFRLQIDPINSDIYVCGNSDTYPISPGVYSNASGNVYIDKLNSTLTTSLLSTRIGDTTNSGFSNLQPAAFLLDVCNNVYISCLGAGGVACPLTANAYQTASGGFWLGVLSPNFQGLTYGSYMGSSGDHIDGGSSRFDPLGIVYQSVCTNNAAMYSGVGVWSPAKLSPSWDVASFKFNFELIGAIASTSISPNDSGCAPYSVVFTNTSSGGSSYHWDFGDGDTSIVSSPTHIYTNPGVYNVQFIVTNNSSSCSAADTLNTTITVYGGANGQFTYVGGATCGSSDVQFYLQDSLQSSTVTYLWSFGDGTFSTQKNPKHTYLTQSIFTVKCVATSGICKDSMSVTIDLSHTIDASFSYFNNDDSLCTGELVSTDGSLSQVLSNLTFEWNWGDGTITNAKPIGTHTYTTGGVFDIQLIITDLIGCKDTLNKKMFMASHGLSVSPTDTNLCLGDKFFALATSTGTSTNPTITWTPASGLSCTSCTDPLVEPIVTTNYTILRTDEFNCKDTATMNVNILQLPVLSILNGDSLIVPFNSPVNLQAIGGNVYNWFPSWGLGTTNLNNTILTPQSDYLYFVHGIDTNGCKGIDSIYITVNYRSPIFIPNAFTPNGDGLNDFFSITNFKFQKIQEFRVFNRWGMEVYSSNSPKGWDGNFKGKAMDMDTYNYFIKIAYPDGFVDSYKGDVILVR